MTAERKAKLKEILMDLLFDIIGGILYAAGIYSFASQAEFAPGGISGLAIIINHFTQWPIGICTLVLNIPIVIICIRTLGKKFFFKSIKTMVISTVIIDFVFPLLPVYKGDARPLFLRTYIKAMRSWRRCSRARLAAQGLRWYIGAVLPPAARIFL